MRIALATVLLLGACAGTGPGPTAQSAAQWQEPAQYEYTVDSRCGERLLIGRFQITVADGKVTKAAGVDEAAQRIASDPKLLANLPTLKQLLDEYETARHEGAHVAKAEFDPADGHPTKIELDPLKNSIDDEACYQISDYRPRT